jgi:acyl-CoA thioester hydrolase
VPHRFDVRIYYEDTDAGGIVYHAGYLRFAERARTELLRAHGIDHRLLLERHGGIFVVTRAEIDFRRAARLDDVLTVETDTESMTRVRLVLRQRIAREAEIVADLKVSLAFLSPDLRPLRLPPLPDFSAD